MNTVIAWLENHLFACPVKQFMYIDCPGCGLQRSIIALLEGDMVKSFQLYPATIPMLFCFIFTALHIIFNFKHGAAIIKVSFILCVLTILVFYFYKIFTNKLI
ncbi:MAG: DUF2752 domain-containing protein [Dysgonamonadaceae bacterium]|jgi:hypothetical protein|nr:DUF2752 domain-containing protein [Dysgonamonadaceae bacterium]